MSNLCVHKISTSPFGANFENLKKIRSPPLLLPNFRCMENVRICITLVALIKGRAIGQNAEVKREFRGRRCLLVSSDIPMVAICQPKPIHSFGAQNRDGQVHPRPFSSP